MITLSFDTCLPVGSVTLLKGDSVIASSSWSSHREHVSRLFEEVERVLSTSNLKVGDVDLFVSTAGPGSFTGIRISLSVAKAVSFKGRVVTVSTLEATAAPYLGGSNVLSLIEARRGRVYALCLSDGGVLFGPFDISPDDLISKLERMEIGNLLICGNALKSEELRQRLSAFGRIMFPFEFPVSTGAALYALKFGYRKSLEPIYLREHDARRPNS